MNKIKTSTILLATLLAIVTPVLVTSAYGQVETVRIRFNAYAEGKCGMGYGNPGPNGSISPYDWVGIAKGNAIFSGKADAVLIDPSTILGEEYFSENPKTCGIISLSWTEEDNSKHHLTIMLYTTDTTEGIFFPDTDYFAVPLGGPNAGAVALSFKGIHRTGFTIQKISGFALFSAMPFGNPMQPPPNIWGIIVTLLETNTQKLYHILWLSEQVDIPVEDQGTILTVPAAKILHSNVEIKK